MSKLALAHFAGIQLSFQGFSLGRPQEQPGAYQITVTSHSPMAARLSQFVEVS
jgi:hypothetical protein